MERSPVELLKGVRRGVVVALLAAGGLLAFGTSAYAATFTPGTGIEQTFLPKYGTTYASTEQSYVVPPGVTQLHILAVGASGETIQGSRRRWDGSDLGTQRPPGRDALDRVRTRRRDRKAAPSRRAAPDSPAGSTPAAPNGNTPAAAKAAGTRRSVPSRPKRKNMFRTSRWNRDSSSPAAGAVPAGRSANRTPTSCRKASLRSNCSYEQVADDPLGLEPGRFKYIPDTRGGTGGAGGTAGVPGPAGAGGGGLYSNSNNTEEIPQLESVAEGARVVPVVVKITEAPHAEGSSGGGGGWRLRGRRSATERDHALWDRRLGRRGWLSRRRSDVPSARSGRQRLLRRWRRRAPATTPAAVGAAATGPAAVAVPAPATRLRVPHFRPTR